jgi:pimeloyl-ACP methyl ester carboxylesterase
MNTAWEDRLVVAAGHRLHLRCAPGPAAARTTAPVVVLHDAGAESIDAPAWDLVATRQSVVQVLLPGIGRSDPVPAGADVRWMADVLGALLTDLHAAGGTGLRQLVGTSLGGWFALETALAHPGLVDRLLLLDPAGLHSPARYLFALFADGQGTDGHDGLLGPLMRQHGTSADPAAAAPYVAGMTAAALHSWNAHIGDPSLLVRVRDLDIPSTIMWGAADALIPLAHGDALAQAIGAQAQLVVVPGAGHLLAVDAPEQVASRLVP